ncbi:MAG: PLP-dependent aminotransferase family protein [Candidatus Rokuibacteriota bacterium]|nr:MAG: PLP-dependent aminotransferase family protein [Candidatus Rokubacteria bacterium]
MNLALDRDKPVPLAHQIRAHLERLIRERRLAAGAKLPATRELARDLGVNRATVALAYEELVAAGLAHAHVGRGTFVAPPTSHLDGAGSVNGDAVRAARPAIDWAALVSRHAQSIAEDDDRRRGFAREAAASVISFAGGMPDSGLFPTEPFRRVLNQVVRDEGEKVLQYYAAAGYPPLRSYLARYLLRFGVEARPEEILIVNGSQQGFDLIARTFVDPGDVVAIEQPTYPRAAQVFRAFGAQLLAAPWDTEGPRPDAFQRLVTRHAPKFFYCQPTGHNPTGLAVTAERAEQLLALAIEHQVPIVEDGFDASVHYGTRPAMPLAARDRDGGVLYLGTFSKILFPGLRLGWIVAPIPVIERLEAAKRVADLHTSALIQAAVHRFCASRLLDRHVTRAAAEYRRRRDALLAALRRRMPDGVTWTEPSGGFSLLVTLPPSLDAAVVLPDAIERGVAFTPGAAFFVDGGGAPTLRLSFSGVPVGRIDEGVRRLAEVIRGHVKRTRPRVERVAVPVV